MTTPLLSGICSMNSTWRQFCASSWPVLSKLSRRSSGLFPSSWFHSLHATSHALQPMHIDVSVKKPTGRSCKAAISVPHQVRRDLGEATLRGRDVERERRELVDHRHRVALEARVDADDVALAPLAGVDAQVRQLLRIGEHDELARLGLAARDAGHARIDPLARAARTDQTPLACDERLAAVDEEAHLRQPAADRTEALLPRDRKGPRDLREGLEHRRGRGAREEHVGPFLLVTAEPRRHDPLEVAFVEAQQDGFAQRLRARGHDGAHHVGERGAYDVRRERVDARAIRAGAREHALLRLGHRAVQGQRLACEVVALGELARAAAPVGVAGHAFRDGAQSIFSMFTRNALNSGVLAPTSPTNGVSAFASQYLLLSGFCSADTPTKPQWIGMPMWYTGLSLPASFTGPSRLVTAAATSIFPRSLDTRTRS